MSDRSFNKASAKRSNAAGIDDRHRDAAGTPWRRVGNILGLRAFENISAVEGIRLSGEMRKDLEALDAQQTDEGERTRFILEKYSRK